MVTRAKNSKVTERQHTLAALSLIRAARTTAAPDNLYAQAAGRLTRVAAMTGETGVEVARRLRLTRFDRWAMRKITLPAVRRFWQYGKKNDWSCVCGRRCECTSQDAKHVCGNWRNGDPSLIEGTP